MKNYHYALIAVALIAFLYWYFIGQEKNDGSTPILKARVMTRNRIGDDWESPVVSTDRKGYYNAVARCGMLHLFNESRRVRCMEDWVDQHLG